MSSSQVSLPERVTEYQSATKAFLDAVKDVTDAELDYTPAGEWSVRWIVHHIADAEANAYVRLRRLLAEPAPTNLQAFDEVAWSRHLRYNRPIAASLSAFQALRQTNVEILATLAESDLRRMGRHETAGPMTLDQWLLKNTNHVVDHALQIKRNRADARS